MLVSMCQTKQAHARTSTPGLQPVATKRGWAAWTARAKFLDRLKPIRFLPVRDSARDSWKRPPTPAGHRLACSPTSSNSASFASLDGANCEACCGTQNSGSEESTGTFAMASTSSSPDKPVQPTYHKDVQAPLQEIISRRCAWPAAGATMIRSPAMRQTVPKPWASPAKLQPKHLLHVLPCRLGMCRAAATHQPGVQALWRLPQGASDMV